MEGTCDCGLPAVVECCGQKFCDKCMKGHCADMAWKRDHPDSAPTKPSEFEKDRQAFLAMKETLLQNPLYREKFVAILNGEVVDHGDDMGQVAKRVYGKFGYMPIYIDKVTAEPETFENSSPE